ncbi:MAG: hypothetical protein AMS18_09805 [Gemmatimonas sp. SG8_17]|nr:MAG: hypothetical protein AMS18_09805 [Gemmatimonas sp. SG8_17]
MAGAVLALMMALPVQAQDVDVTGKWETTRETPRGTMTTTFTFVQEGSELTGTVGSQRGDSEITNGSIEGNKISFTLVMTMGDRTMEMVYSGTVEGDTITGTMQTPRGEQPWTAKRASGS